MEELNNFRTDGSYESEVELESKTVDALSMNKDSFNISIGVVDFRDISFSEAMKKGRKETYLGLTKSVEELGILNPIHVMRTEGYADWLESGGSENDYEGWKYIVIDGFRRIYAGVKNGLTRCNAVIWDFKDKELGSDLLMTVSLYLNKKQKHSWGEVWYLFQILELQSSMTPATLEFLLQLESGEAMKLKDIMLSEYDEIKQALLNNEKAITQAYNMLQKERKEENQIYKEDKQGISSVEEAGDIVDGDGSNRPKLSDEDVKQLLDLVENEEEFSDDDFGEWSGEEIEDHWQDRKNGDRIDERLRLSILERDGYTCQVSGFGKGLPIALVRGSLSVHHKVPVSLGGRDSVDNLVTLSNDYHNLIHRVAETGKLGITKEEYDKLDDGHKEIYKNVMKYVRAITKAKEATGKKLEKHKDIRKAFWEK